MKKNNYFEIETTAKVSNSFKCIHKTQNNQKL